MTELLEFSNHVGETLRALVERADAAAGIICVHGFERTTVESKFKHVVDAVKGRASTMRFDFSGCGISDGNFKNQSVAKMVAELESAIVVFKNACPQVSKITIVAHSLAGAVVAELVHKHPALIDRVVCLAPAFNQRDLQRFWFTTRAHKDMALTWENFREYIDEAAFQKDLQIHERMVKEHEITNEYFLETENADYRETLASSEFALDHMLVIHGTGDDKVPLASNMPLPEGVRFIEVSKGDHDMQRPDKISQWLPQAIQFLLD